MSQIDPTKLAYWLSFIPDAAPLTKLSLPGSHDSCAHFDHELLPDTAKCQNLSLRDQLTCGVRFLDIRCRHIVDTFRMYHGDVDQRMTFDQVLADCWSFLQANPSEAIVVSVKEESRGAGNTRSFEATFDAYVAGNEERWYLAGSTPNLGAIRGKLFLFRRFVANTPKGLDGSQWQENTTFSVGNYLKVQDKYIVLNNDDKWNAIVSLYSAADVGSTEELFLNFTSGYDPLIAGIPRISSVSSFINPRLLTYLQTTPGPRSLGITVMDFVDPQLCRSVILTNQLGAT